MTMPPLAHVGHWALWIVYAVPVVVVLASIVATMLRDRERRNAEQAPRAPG
jgi:ABC-type multidrug transport system permease subunit